MIKTMYQFLFTEKNRNHMNEFGLNSSNFTHDHTFYHSDNND